MYSELPKEEDAIGILQSICSLSVKMLSSQVVFFFIG